MFKWLFSYREVISRIRKDEINDSHNIWTGIKMASGPRAYTPQTLKKLFALSGNQCAFPGCAKQLVNERNAKESNICHIEAANFDGERYRANMTDKKRADYDNLILLCIQHHDETNDVKRYTVELLKEMKKNHISDRLNDKIQRKPSMLRNTINAISKIDIDDDVNSESISAFSISDKLVYNSVKRYAPLIQEYKVYHHKINSLYDELEVQGSLKKNKILQTVRSYYLKAKGVYVGDAKDSIAIVRAHSDDIIDDVCKKISDELDGSGLYEDDIIFGVDLVVVDAFMRCRILEEPKTDDSK